MDLSFLPKIFRLVVFLVAFRPLLRRAGAHTNIWFLGVSFLLFNGVLQMLPPGTGWAGMLLSLGIRWSVALCALSFLMVTANVPIRRISRRSMTEFILPVLLQSACATLAPAWSVVNIVCCLLFLLPGLHLFLQRSRRNRPVVIVALGFAGFALLLAPLAARHPASVADGALTLLFLSSAYLYLVSAAQVTRGVVVAVAGLVGWALRYPVVALLTRINPAFHLDMAVLEFPQYLIGAGIILTLLEEHITRTERMAMHDPLTDLPNRRLFEERLIATMEEARINHTTVACLVIDVDNFKHINDTLGHTAGDQLLRSLAVRLSWHMSPRDILARTGGDEFTALLAGVNDEHHLRFIAGAMMSAASVPIQIDGHSVDVRISVGIALSPDDADDIDTLRRAADEAMYSAKRRGGSLLAFAGDR